MQKLNKKFKAKGIMVEYSSRCNLRCSYCPKSNPGDDKIPGRNQDMSEEIFDKLLEAIRLNKTNWLLLAGTGESLFNKNWKTDFKKLIKLKLKKNLRLLINTNFALSFNDDDFEVLSKLDELIISIDTDQRDITKKIRSKSDLSLIIFNILALQSFCKINGLKLPNVAVNVTLHSDLLSRLPNLISLLSCTPVSQITVSGLIENQATHINNIKPVSQTDFHSIEVIRDRIKYCIDLGNKFDIMLNFQPDLLDRLGVKDLFGSKISSESGGNKINPIKFSLPLLSNLKIFLNFQGWKKLINKNNQSNLSSKEQKKIVPQSSLLSENLGKKTKLCLQPFTRFTLAANGDIFPCCVTSMKPLGNALFEDDPFNNQKITEFRLSLLNGDIPEPCVNCTNAPNGLVRELRELVKLEEI